VSRAPLLLSLGLWVASAASGAAQAQSVRYPPPPVDKDRALDETSSLWEQATEPGRAPQAALLAAARRLIAARTPSDLENAAAKATEAITLRASDAIAYFVRGAAREQLGRWAECAADYQRAIDLDPKLSPDPELRGGGSPLLGLGICQARAGRLSEAELSLDQAVSHNPAGVEEWIRLAETRIAMGKLREGLEALAASTDASHDPQPSAFNLWLRALAYDRSLQASLAAENAQAAAVVDRFFRQLTSPSVPFIHEAEQQYVLGLAWESTAHPELALAYFRGVVFTQPEGLWKRRAHEHVELLEQSDFPQDLTRVGPAPIDGDVAKAALHRQLGSLTACVTELPLVVFEIKITRSHPSLPGNGPRVVPPPPGVQVAPSVIIGAPPAAALERAGTCLKAAAQHVELPPIKDPGTWHHLTFSIVAPGTAPGHPRKPAP
jgi:tetratricopeptide (TPR) repeat protein